MSLATTSARILRDAAPALRVEQFADLEPIVRPFRHSQSKAFSGQSLLDRPQCCAGLDPDGHCDWVDAVDAAHPCERQNNRRPASLRRYVACGEVLRQVAEGDVFFRAERGCFSQLVNGSGPGDAEGTGAGRASSTAVDLDCVGSRVSRPPALAEHPGKTTAEIGLAALRNAADSLPRTPLAARQDSSQNSGASDAGAYIWMPLSTGLPISAWSPCACKNAISILKRARCPKGNGRQRTRSHPLMEHNLRDKRVARLREEKPVSTFPDHALDLPLLTPVKRATLLSARSSAGRCAMPMLGCGSAARAPERRGSEHGNSQPRRQRPAGLRRRPRLQQFRPPHRSETSRKVIHKALDRGITLFDTADIYGGRGGSETVLGRCLGDRRKDIVLATKFAKPMDDSGKKQGASRRYIMAAVEASLKRLKTDCIDLYQQHHPDPRTPIEETLRALDDLVRQGKVLYVGCSNFPAWRMVEAQLTAKAINTPAFVSCQDEYSLLVRSVENDLLPAARSYGMGLLPYFPLANGLLTGKYNDGRRPEGSRLATGGGLRDAYLNERNLSVAKALESFAKARGHTLLELSFSWLASRPQVASVIAGATSEAQIDDNARAISWQLSADDLAEIDRFTAAPA